MLCNWVSYFDPSHRRFSYSPSRLLSDGTTVATISISDTNKAFIVQHEGIFDSLVAALLLQPSDPRRTQQGAAELQRLSAETLQNLAVSSVGAAPMRAMTNHTAPLNNIVHLKDGKCPICCKSRAHKYRPFCSKRCADLDLAKWLSGAYAVPLEEEDEFSDSQDPVDTPQRQTH